MVGMWWITSRLLSAPDARRGSLLSDGLAPQTAGDSLEAPW